MPKFRVEITETAQSDIYEIFQYIAADNQTAATNLIKEIERQIDSLEIFPLRCPIIPESFELGIEYRHVIYGHYRTIFKVENARVIIMRVIHGARLLDLEVFQKTIIPSRKATKGN
ncbi:MAG: type II toxin-antitoxin system RelE/ParE family toxin [Syntrophaceae bacterium]|nr:type II toxin-antitoxin system RelE/ParE family toxin [Syntrophaceae bacterium]